MKAAVATEKIENINNVLDRMHKVGLRAGSLWTSDRDEINRAGCHCWLVQQCFPKSSSLQVACYSISFAPMPSTDLHRKRVKHYHEPGDCHELTFSCYQRRRLLTNDSWREMLSRSIDAATHRHGFGTVAFVFMPEHVHLLVYPLSAAAKVDELLKAIKPPFSYRIKQILVKAQSPLLKRLTIRQRPGVTTFRFWQEGPGYDRNLTPCGSVLAAIDYIHRNPVRRGLVRRAVDWSWSSARWYLQADAIVAPMLPTIHKLPAEFLS